MSQLTRTNPVFMRVVDNELGNARPKGMDNEVFINGDVESGALSASLVRPGMRNSKLIMDIDCTNEVSPNEATTEKHEGAQSVSLCPAREITNRQRRAT